MAMINQTFFTGFVLLGFPNERVLFSLMILVIYLMIIVGNLTIFSVIKIDINLQTPMYFFLSCLSILDICYSTSTLPLMLANAITGNTRVSFNFCIIQLYFFVSLGGVECLLLAAMAFDRYAAICNPLQYPVVMNKEVCSYLVGACWFFGFLNSALHTTLTAKLTFCKHRHINQFFCDVRPMMNVSCGDTHTSQMFLYVINIFLGISPFAFVISSYTHIISTILKIHSAEGRKKAFSTCSSHLIVVIVFYTAGNLNYIGPQPRESFDMIRLSSFFYSVLTPLFNPLVYCLRNHEVQRALKKALTGKYTLK